VCVARAIACVLPPRALTLAMILGSLVGSGGSVIKRGVHVVVLMRHEERVGNALVLALLFGITPMASPFDEPTVLIIDAVLRHLRNKVSRSVLCERAAGIVQRSVMRIDITVMCAICDPFAAMAFFFARSAKRCGPRFLRCTCDEIDWFRIGVLTSLHIAVICQPSLVTSFAPVSTCIFVDMVVLDLAVHVIVLAIPPAIHAAPDACIARFGLIVEELPGAICARLAAEVVRYLHFALARGQSPGAARLATRRPSTPLVRHTVDLAIVCGGIIITMLDLCP